jgi:hypothetical protein
MHVGQRHVLWQLWVPYGKTICHGNPGLDAGKLPFDNSDEQTPMLSNIVEEGIPAIVSRILMQGATMESKEQKCKSATTRRTIVTQG